MSSSSSATPSGLITTSTLSDPGTPKSDHRLLTTVVILAIVATFLIAFIIWLTLRVKRRQSNGESSGPYQGTVMNQDHPASSITPFGAGGPHAGRKAPQFTHTPGEDMRIAVRRPDGAWHFADSRTPFTPTGVQDIDVLPSPMSSSVSLLSLLPHQPLSKKAQEARSYGKGYDSDIDFEVRRTVPPPPAYHREPCGEHFDDARSPV
ncbi:unnamed protein product [Cyclocybe aegerita]|uniref:Uncharacterized protein n=1 Tax=Cyclocybe aegerita TaxID=1973307 RepID=A0A8S0XMD9_CYCAE|nr:unnamed protein product [Cyclocybe aegerita]